MSFALFNPIALENRGRRSKRRGRKKSGWKRSSRSSRRSSSRRSSRGSSRGMKSVNQLIAKSGKTPADVVEDLAKAGIFVDYREPKDKGFIDFSGFNKLRPLSNVEKMARAGLITLRTEPPKGKYGKYRFDPKAEPKLVKEMVADLQKAQSQTSLFKTFKDAGYTDQKAREMRDKYIAVLKKQEPRRSTYRTTRGAWAQPNGLGALVLENPLALTNGIVGGTVGWATGAVLGTVPTALGAGYLLDMATPKFQEMALYPVADATASIPILGTITDGAANAFPHMITGGLLGSLFGVPAVGAMIYRVPVISGIMFGIGAALPLIGAFQDRETIISWARSLVGMEEPSLLSPEADLSLTSAGDLNGLGGLAITGSNLNGYGDGGFFETAPVGAPLSALNYTHASLADAAYSGLDFSVAEGQALLNGPQSFAQYFGAPTMRQGRRAMGPSHYAAKRGHRWGWLVKLLGWARVRKLAALPPKRRLKAIQKIRAQAIKAYQAQVSAAQASGQAAVTFEDAPQGAAGHAAMGAPGAMGAGGAGGAAGAYGSALFLGQ